MLVYDISSCLTTRHFLCSLQLRLHQTMTTKRQRLVLDDSGKKRSFSDDCASLPVCVVDEPDECHQGVEVDDNS